MTFAARWCTARHLLWVNGPTVSGDTDASPPTAGHFHANNQTDVHSLERDGRGWHTLRIVEEVVQHLRDVILAQSAVARQGTSGCSRARLVAGLGGGGSTSGTSPAAAPLPLHAAAEYCCPGLA